MPIRPRIASSCNINTDDPSSTTYFRKQSCQADKAPSGSSTPSLGSSGDFGAPSARLISLSVGPTDKPYAGSESHLHGQKIPFGRFLSFLSRTNPILSVEVSRRGSSTRVYDSCWHESSLAKYLVAGASMTQNLLGDWMLHANKNPILMVAVLVSFTHINDSASFGHLFRPTHTHHSRPSKVWGEHPRSTVSLIKPRIGLAIVARWSTRV